MNDSIFKRYRMPIFWTLACIIYLVRLWEGSFQTFDESLTAERSREILVTGDWLTPHFRGEPDFNKPPLYYWLSAATMYVFGEDEFSVRIWSALFALGCFGLLIRHGRRLGEPNAGLFAAYLLLLNPHWVNRTREGLLDSGLVFFMLLGSYVWSQHPGDTRGAARAGFCFGLGALVKNPLALIGAVPALVERGLRRSRVSLRELAALLGVFAITGLSWYLIQYVRWGDDYTQRFVQHNIVNRVAGPWHGHRGDPWYYLVRWWLYTPVTYVAFLVAVVATIKLGWARIRPFLPYGILVLILLVLLSAMRAKRDLYLLLIYPYAALCTGSWILALLEPLRAYWRRGILGAFAVAACAYFVTVYRPVIDRSSEIKDIAVHIRKHGTPDDLILCDSPSVHNFMFHSHVPAYSITGLPLVEGLTLIKGNPQKVFLVERLGRKARLPREQDALNGKLRAETIIRANNDFRVWLLKPVSTNSVP